MNTKLVKIIVTVSTAVAVVLAGGSQHIVANVEPATALVVQAQNTAV